MRLFIADPELRNANGITTRCFTIAIGFPSSEEASESCRLAMLIMALTSAFPFLTRQYSSTIWQVSPFLLSSLLAGATVLVMYPMNLWAAMVMRSNDDNPYRIDITQYLC
jgi:hypothetical protein